MGFRRDVGSRCWGGAFFRGTDTPGTGGCDPARLVGRTVEVMRELIDSPGAGCVVSTLEFFEHQLSKMGHRDLLVTAPYRDSAAVADDDQYRRACTRSVCRQASFKSAFRLGRSAKAQLPNRLCYARLAISIPSKFLKMRASVRHIDVILYTAATPLGRRAQSRPQFCPTRIFGRRDQPRMTLLRREWLASNSICGLWWGCPGYALLRIFVGLIGDSYRRQCDDVSRTAGSRKNRAISAPGHVDRCAKPRCVWWTRTRNRAGFGSRQDNGSCAAASRLGNLASPFAFAVAPVGAVSPGTHHG